MFFDNSLRKYNGLHINTTINPWETPHVASTMTINITKNGVQFNGFTDLRVWSW